MKNACESYEMVSVNVTKTENGDIQLKKSNVKKIPLSTNPEDIWYENEPIFRYSCHFE